MMDLVSYKAHGIIKDRVVKCIWEVAEWLQRGGEFGNMEVFVRQIVSGNTKG